MNQSSLHLHFPLVKSIQKRPRAEDEECIKKSLKAESAEVHTLKSLITPISSIPTLSKLTTELISSFQTQRPLATAEEILNSIPAKQKYADLLDPLHSFPLPYSYKKLLIFLDALDKSLNYCLLINQQATVHFLSTFMQNKYKTPFCIEMLCQIQYLCEIYRVHVTDKQENWIIGVESGSESLGPELMVRRKELVHGILLKVTEKHHEEFCRSRNIEGYWGNWHPDFDLQGVSPIPKASISKDQVRSIINSEIAPRNAAVGAVFNELAKDSGQSLHDYNKKPEDIQDRVLALNDSIKVSNKVLFSSDKKKDCDRVLAICESLKVLFTSMKTPSIFLTNLYKKLQESELNEQISQDLNFICELFPQWLTIIQTNSGKVLRHNRQSALTLKQIQETVKSSYEAFI